jgi:hypothetical protein
MTFNIPIQSELVSTSVIDSTSIFTNTLRENYVPDKQLQHNNKIYVNATGAIINIPVYNANTTYVKGNFAFKDGVIKIANDTAIEVPKQPEEYLTGFDTSWDWRTWTKRYMKVDALGLMDAVWARATYSVSETVKIWIDFSPQTQASQYYWNPATNYTFDRSIRASLTKFYTQIQSLTPESSPALDNVVVGETESFPLFAPSTVITNASGTYIRTHINAPIEYKTVSGILWETVIDPTQLGFSYLGITRNVMPFDTKQYISVIEQTRQQWTIKALKRFNGVSLGRLRGTYLDVSFRDAANSTLSYVSKPIDGSIDANLEDEPITEIIYAGQYIEAGGIIYIQISGTTTEVGTIFPSASIDVGITDLEFSHDIKNFDRNVVSEISGYVDHIKGNRVIQHKGSFHIEMQNYDKMVLLNKKLTQELVAIDGSDMTNNEIADGSSRFASTKIICRVKQLNMKSKIKDGDMSKYTPVSFEFEEVV